MTKTRFRDKLKSKDEITLKSRFSYIEQLGWFVGEYIYFRYLPTLSTDPIRTLKTIAVSEEETAEHKRLESEWFNQIKTDRLGSDNSKWKAFQAYDKFLEEKYLPKILKCHIPVIEIDPSDHDEFKKGLTTYLWDTDVCSYSLKFENIKIYNEEKYFTVIEFVLASTVNDFN